MEILRVPGTIALAAVSIYFTSPPRAGNDEKLAQRVAGIDTKFIKALGALAQEYDGAKNPEAAHFFAECFLGFGGKDPAVAVVKGAYMGETGDYKSKEWTDNKSGENPQKDNVFWGDVVDFAGGTRSRLPHSEISTITDRLRSSALTREDILNLDARRLWLGRWAGGRKIPGISLYCIPAVEYRQDVPTPSKRYTTDSQAKGHPEWVDTEETATINGRKVPFVRYPYDGEPDTPRRFGREYGWAESEEEFLAKAAVPIMLRIFSRHSLAEASVALRDKPGKDIPCRLYTDRDERVQFHVDWPTLLAVPERELDKDTKYTVTMTCTLDATRFERTGSFTTRSK